MAGSSGGPTSKSNENKVPKMTKIAKNDHQKEKFLKKLKIRAKTFIMEGYPDQNTKLGS